MEAAKPSLTIAPRRSRLAELLNVRYLDPVMLGASIGLIAFSIFTLESASRHEVAADPLYFVERQSLYGVIGIVLMIALSHIDYTRLRELRVSIYAVMVGSIAFVLLVGTAVRGSNRWIELPLFQFEPSELAKVLLCVSLAAWSTSGSGVPSACARQSGCWASAWRPRHSSSCSRTSAQGSSWWPSP